MFVLLLTACTGASDQGGKDTTTAETAPIDTGVGDTDTGEAVETADTVETAETADTTHSRLDTSERDECELVQDTAPTRPTSVECDPTLPWVQVVAGLRVTCGVKSDGCGECWGEAMDDSVFQVPGVSFKKIALSSMTWQVGVPHICGISVEGELLCWGGSNWADENLTPIGTFKDVATGSTEGWALGADGGIVEWGWSTHCLDGEYSQVVGSDLSYGAIREDGTLEVSGLISYPFVADGTWTTIAHGSLWVCGIRSDLDGAVRCVGAASADETTIPFDGANPEGSYVDVCATANFGVCALDATGAPTCWSYGSEGSILDPSPGPFTQITCGGSHACGLTPEGAIECWGDDYFGETIPPS